MARHQLSMRLHADINLRAVTLPFMEALRDKLGETDAGATADNRVGFIGSWRVRISVLTSAGDL